MTKKEGFCVSSCERRRFERVWVSVGNEGNSSAAGTGRVARGSRVVDRSALSLLLQMTGLSSEPA